MSRENLAVAGILPIEQGAGRPRVKGPPICHNLPMCGRYRLSRRKQVVEEYFDSVSDEPDWNPRYNIAPTQPGGRWKLRTVPHWLKAK